MKQPKVYDYLKHLELSDVVELLQFSKSKMKKDSELYTLLSYLIKARFELPSLTQLCDELYPHLNRKNVSNKLHLIKEIIEEYFIMNCLSKNDDLKAELLIDALVHRGHYSEANRKLKKYEDKLRKACHFDSNKFLALHRIEHLSYFSNRPKSKAHGPKPINYSKEVLDQYVGLVYQKYRIEKKFAKQLEGYKTEHELDFLSSDHFQIQELYYCLDKVLTNDCLYSLDRICSLLTNWPIKHINEDYVFAIMHLINHLRKKIKQDNYKYDPQILLLYDLILKYDIYSVNGFIQFTHFENMIDFACSFNELDWANKVIASNINKIEPSLRSSVKAMCLAHICFYNKEFNVALDHLLDVKLSSPEHMLRSKWLGIMCYYEMKSWNQFESSVNSLSTYVRNHKSELSNKRYAGIINFISLVRKLKSDVDIQKLLQSFSKHESIVKGTWIKQKIIERTPESKSRSSRF